MRSRHPRSKAGVFNLVWPGKRRWQEGSRIINAPSPCFLSTFLALSPDPSFRFCTHFKEVKHLWVEQEKAKMRLSQSLSKA